MMMTMMIMMIHHYNDDENENNDDNNDNNDDKDDIDETEKDSFPATIHGPSIRVDAIKFFFFSCLRLMMIHIANVYLLIS